MLEQTGLLGLSDSPGDVTAMICEVEIHLFPPVSLAIFNRIIASTVIAAQALTIRAA